jgi:glutathione S-transferase
MKLYGICLSPYVRKVAAVLNLKGLDCERDDSMPGAVPSAISPLGKIPAFSDGDLHLADSTVICEYLEEKYPDVPVMPRSLADRARARWLEELADSKLGELCGGGIFFQRVVKGMMGAGPADEARVADTIDNLLPPVQDYLESQIPQDGFLFGEPGLADISIATHFINAAYAGYEVDAARWPRLAGLIARVSALPAMQREMKTEAALMAAMAGKG